MVGPQFEGPPHVPQRVGVPPAGRECAAEIGVDDGRAAHEAQCANTIGAMSLLNVTGAEGARDRPNPMTPVAYSCRSARIGSMRLAR